MQQRAICLSATAVATRLSSPAWVAPRPQIALAPARGAVPVVTARRRPPPLRVAAVGVAAAAARCKLFASPVAAAAVRLQVGRQGLVARFGERGRGGPWQAIAPVRRSPAMPLAAPPPPTCHCGGGRESISWMYSLVCPLLRRNRTALSSRCSSADRSPCVLRRGGGGVAAQFKQG